MRDGIKVAQKYQTRPKTLYRREKVLEEGAQGILSGKMLRVGPRNPKLEKENQRLKDALALQTDLLYGKPYIDIVYSRK